MTTSDFIVSVQEPRPSTPDSHGVLLAPQSGSDRGIGDTEAEETRAPKECLLGLNDSGGSSS